MFSGKHWKEKRVLTEFGFALLCDISLEKKGLRGEGKLCFCHQKPAKLEQFYPNFETKCIPSKYIILSCNLMEFGFQNLGTESLLSSLCESCKV